MKCLFLEEKLEKIIKVEKHPIADKLKVCQVKTKSGEFQVVCGAPNARKGMLGIFAPENSYIPGTELHLKKTKIGSNQDEFISPWNPETSELYKYGTEPPTYTQHGHPT